MTGEDMIVQEAAKLLRESRDDEHTELRRVFWIAGRCEHCGAPHQNDGKMRCPGCKRAIVNRCSADPEPTEPVTRVPPPLVHSAVASGRHVHITTYLESGTLPMKATLLFWCAQDATECARVLSAACSIRPDDPRWSR